jgi:hypothetical protein
LLLVSSDVKPFHTCKFLAAHASRRTNCMQLKSQRK